MPKGIIYVETMPASPDREAEYHKWYNDTHLEQIRVNAVHPTNVNTDMLHSRPMYKAFRPDLENPTREDAEIVFPMIQGMPIPYVEPEDISEAVLFLASDAARYVTGQQLRVDAGGFLKIKPWSGP